MDQAPWMPTEGKQAVNGWINAVKKNENDCKQMIDDYFTSVEDFFVADKATEKPATAPKKAANKA
jgi:predicted DNA-binding protein